MRINNLFPKQSLTRPAVYRYIGRGGEYCSREENVLVAHTFSTKINGDICINFSCLPQLLPELIIGHLLSEGYAASADDIKEITISESGCEAAVSLEHISCPRELPDVTPIRWKTEWVFALADRFAQGMPIHSQTFAAHSCFLAKEDKLLFQAEDIGRHNALDKAIGYAVRNGIPLSECLLYSSGRMPIDMVSKAIRAGVPVLISKGSPTAHSVELAQKHGLSLICAARCDRIKLFSGNGPEI